MDKHVVKMILEYCQLLSTAHRVLDGVERLRLSESGRRIKRYVLPDNREKILYSATHIKHPSAIWCRDSERNYNVLHELLTHLCDEYTYRYGKVHKCEQIGLVDKLSHPPKHIDCKKKFTPPTPAMPEEIVIPGDVVASYRNYYNVKKQHIASWAGKVNARKMPAWFIKSKNIDNK
ncbi:MAG: hypothetical protein V4490_04070 [Pseudomonadota bacterium]